MIFFPRKFQTDQSALEFLFMFGFQLRILNLLWRWDYLRRGRHFRGKKLQISFWEFDSPFLSLWFPKCKVRTQSFQAWDWTLCLSSANPYSLHLHIGTMLACIFSGFFRLSKWLKSPKWQEARRNESCSSTFLRLMKRRPPAALFIPVFFKEHQREKLHYDQQQASVIKASIYLLLRL